METRVSLKYFVSYCRKIRKMSSTRDCPDKGFPKDFIVTAHEEAAIQWGSLGSHGCADKLEKMPVHK